MTEWIKNVMGIHPEFQGKIFLSILVVVLVWSIHRVVLKFGVTRIKKRKAKYQGRKVSSYIAFFLTVLIVGRLWIEGLQSIMTFFGVLSAGLAVALKDPISDLAGWAFILSRKPFEVGDRIQIEEHAGDVIDIRIFQFTLSEIGNWVEADQNTGRVIHIPNGKVFTKMLANFGKWFKYIWNEVPVLVTFESDWQKAKKVLTKIANTHAEHLSAPAEKKVRAAARKYFIYFSNLEPSVYTSVKDSGVMLTVRYLCDPHNRRDSEQSIWEDILVEFAKNPDIEFAYPTQRFYTQSEAQIPPVSKVSGKK